MALLAITGKIGSGKSYYAVNYLLKKYYDFIPELFDYVPKKNLIIVSNIRSLLLEHIDLQQELDKYDNEKDGLKAIFSETFVNKFPGCNIIYIIDECQKFFDRKYYDKEVFLFFQTCRHFGTDVLIITQDMASVAKEIRVLYENEIVCAPRSKRLKNVFRYTMVSGSDTVGTENIKFDRRVASYYTSFLSDEVVKPKSMLTKYVVIAVSLLSAVVISFIIFVNTMFGNSNKPKTPKTVNPPAVSNSQIINNKEEIAKLNNSVQTAFKKENDHLQEKSNTNDTINFEQKKTGNTITLYENGKYTGKMMFIQQKPEIIESIKNNEVELSDEEAEMYKTYLADIRKSDRKIQ